MEIIQPAWPVPPNVIAGTTTRLDGLSQPPFDSLNLALHVDDNESDVMRNRQALNSHIASVAGLSEEQLIWQWLNQTHSNRSVKARTENHATENADAVWSDQILQVCVVLTADCLPILLADRKGRAVAAIHAGWRGLCNAVVENCVAKLCGHANTANGKPVKAVDLQAWLGPAIGPGKFEVGSDVLQAFQQSSFAEENNRDAIAQAFRASGEDKQEKYLCDLYQLAAIALNSCGIKQIYGGGFCTVSQNQQFFSYRRDQKTGRMASFIALLPT